MVKENFELTVTKDVVDSSIPSTIRWQIFACFDGLVQEENYITSSINKKINVFLLSNNNK